MLEYFVVFEKLVDLVGSAHFYKVLSSVVDSLLCFAPSCFAYILLPLLSYVVLSHLPHFAFVRLLHLVE